MSKYTTGEVAKLCGVTVRTVQYYDTRGILVPAELSEGGRRLYSEDDLKRMRVICFLRDLGFSIDAIGKLLSDDDPAAVIDLLIDQQTQALRSEIGERQEQLNREFGAYAAGVCDYVVLVGKANSDSIYEGLISAGYPAEKIYVAEELGDGLQKAYAADAAGKEKIILLENDLPDNF